MLKYTPCPGSNTPAIECRTMNTTGLGNKFSSMHGKRAGRCGVCRKSVRPVRDDMTPTHKASV